MASWLKWWVRDTACGAWCRACGRRHPWRGGPKTIVSEMALAKYRATPQPGVKHYAARPFLVPALRELEPHIRAALEAVLNKAIKK